jgi:hypothetical protein
VTIFFINFLCITNLALSGITVRQAAGMYIFKSNPLTLLFELTFKMYNALFYFNHVAHYAIPRTTLCAYMKRKGIAGKRLAGSGGVTTYQNQQQQIEDTDGGGGDDDGEDYNEENEFPFMGGLANLVKGHTSLLTHSD